MNVKEIAAYLHIKGKMDPDTISAVEKIYPVADGTPATIRERKFSLVENDEGVRLVGTEITLRGNTAKRAFFGCTALYVVLVTMGMESERRIKAEYALSPTRGVILDACYSEVVERRLDEYESKKKTAGEELVPRVSCGYGDLPLEAQAPLLALLGAEKAGVYQNESCMLTPNKSVVALIGVKG